MTVTPLSAFKARQLARDVGLYDGADIDRAVNNISETLDPIGRAALVNEMRFQLSDTLINGLWMPSWNGSNADDLNSLQDSIVARTKARLAGLLPPDVIDAAFAGLSVTHVSTSEVAP